MSGHTARNRVDGKLYFHALSFQHSSQCCHIGLGLRKRHTVTGNNDYLLCILQGGANDLLGNLCRLCGSSFLLLHLGGGRSSSGGFSGENGNQLPVHSLAHILGQDQAGSAYNTANSNQQRLIDSHTGNAAGHAGQGVQKRNGNGHICAAHTHNKHNAKSKGQSRNHNSPCAGGNGLQNDTRHGQHCQRAHNQAVARQTLGSCVQNTGQLAGGDQAAGKGQCANCQCKTGGSGLKGGNTAVHGRNGSNQCGCAAAQAVEQSDKLGHCDHFCFCCNTDTDNRTDSQRQQNCHNYGDSRGLNIQEEYQPNGKDHSDGGQSVTLYRAFYLAHHINAQKNDAYTDTAESIVKIIIHPSSLPSSQNC